MSLVNVSETRSGAARPSSGRIARPPFWQLLATISVLAAATAAGIAAAASVVAVVTGQW
jgi:hypothetical protein